MLPTSLFYVYPFYVWCFSYVLAFLIFCFVTVFFCGQTITVSCFGMAISSDVEAACRCSVLEILYIVMAVYHDGVYTS